MKIGVVTTQYSTNYGALLQTYALQKYLTENFNADVEVVNYWPAHAKQYWKVFLPVNSIADGLLNVYSLCHPKKLLDKKKLLNVFQKFLDANVKMSDPYFSSDELKKNNGDYDVLICGSDQIWNLTRHNDPVWFLYFSKDWKDVKKIAYAPSVADSIPEGYEEDLKKYLSNLDYISVRESMDVEQLKPYSDKDIRHVCDPVLLLSPSKWEEVIPSSNINEPYIFCYFISVGDYATKVVKRIKEITGLKVVYANVNARDKFDADIEVRTADPFEFVRYLKDASFVVTNSFHGTAFSVLFEKNFYAISKQKGNNRITSLLEKGKLENRLITKDQMYVIEGNKLEIDYTNHDFSSWIEESKQYLENALKEV